VSSSDEYRRRICRAVDYINEHLSENLSVAEIASAAPFSSFHFQRLFRAVLGESVGEFTRRIRLETAARRLKLVPSQDITGLAMELGFSSSQNFAKAFKKHFEATPSQYRDQSETVPESMAAKNELIDRIRENRGSNFEVSIVTLKPCRVAYIRHFGSYRDPDVQVAFDRLEAWARAREVDSGEFLGIPWDDAEITPDQKCRFDACITVADDAWFGKGVNCQTILGGKFACLRCEIANNDFERPWNLLLAHWLPDSGFQPSDGPRFERYHSDGSRDAEGKWDIEVCLPVKPL
jgi:AraC family transcriptional regulator